MMVRHGSRPAEPTVRWSRLTRRVVRIIPAGWREHGVPPPFAVAIVAAAVALGLVAAAVAAVVDGSGRETRPAIVAGTPSGTRSYSTPPPRDVKQVHDVLHAFDRWCTPQADARARQRLARGAEVIVSFARRHPDARFRIDDETGTTVSLLLVARNELRVCAPAAAASADRALPAKIRQRLTPLTTGRTG